MTIEHQVVSPATIVKPTSVRFPLRLSERRAILLAGDLFAAATSAVVAVLLWIALRADMTLATVPLGQYTPWVVGLTTAWGLLMALAGGYNVRTSAHVSLIAVRVGMTALLFLGGYLLFYFLFANDERSVFAPFGEIAVLRAVPLAFALTAPLLTLLWRSGYAVWLTDDSFKRRLLLVGAGHAAHTLLQAFRQERAEIAYEVVGLIDDDVAKLGQAVLGFPVLGTRDNLVQIVQDHHVDELVLAISGGVSGPLFEVIMECFEQGIQITPMPVMYETLAGRVPVEHVGAMWYVSLPVGAKPPHILYNVLSRLVDLVLSVIGLAVLGIVLPFIWIGNRISSPGPLFFRQERVGRGGKPYTILKLRTMVPDAEKTTGAVWAQEQDPRVTPLGRILRRSRLDELPQFWNVVKGEMAIIGPRPERPGFVQQLEEVLPFYNSRHAVKPGLTGWAQVCYRYGSSVADALEKLQYDLYYIKHRSVWLDLLILYKTIRVVVGLKGR